MSTGILLDNWNIVGNILLRIHRWSLEYSEGTGIGTAVEKIRNTIKCEEYRPINTLRTAEKIVENQLEEYFEKHSLLSKCQSGFRKGIRVRRQLTM